MDLYARGLILGNVKKTKAKTINSYVEGNMRVWGDYWMYRDWEFPGIVTEEDKVRRYFQKGDWKIGRS